MFRWGILSNVNPFLYWILKTAYERSMIICVKIYKQIEEI